MQQLQIPPLAEGETYIGAIGDKNGDVHHVILLPGDNDDATFANALEWAKSIGGDLPSKVEAAMLCERARCQFKPVWYWTNATFVDPDDEDDDRYAWYQDFYDGTHGTYHKDYELRARAVRRLPIQLFIHSAENNMTTITLAAIEAEQSKIAEMIAALKAQAETRPAFVSPEATIDLAPGEEYAGLIFGMNGEPSYHLVLLPGDAGGINWKDAVAWAKGQGGELPTRREQSLLFANLKERFEDRTYWSAQEHESNKDYAWCQDFLNGFQDYDRKNDELRARAVRRLVIE